MMIEEWASQLISKNIPFKAHGRSEEGLDCWGVVWLGHKEVFGNNIPSYSEGYEPGDIRDFVKLESLIKSHLPVWQPVTDVQPGDVVLMRLGGRPIHVGLVIKAGIMLHIEENINLCLENYGKSIWKNRVIGIYRFSTSQ